jgi:hypothetical protein
MNNLSFGLDTIVNQSHVTYILQSISQAEKCKNFNINSYSDLCKTGKTERNAYGEL